MQKYRIVIRSRRGGKVCEAWVEAINWEEAEKRAQELSSDLEDVYPGNEWCVDC